MSGTFDNLVVPVGFFLGLLGAYAGMFQVGHLRHHELSLDCFRLRDRLSPELTKFLEKKAVSTGTNDLADARAILAEQKLACDHVFNRYYWATLGFKCIAVGTVGVLLIGMDLACTFVYTGQVFNWVIPAILVAVLPGLFGTGAILFGDLLQAGKANTIFHNQFANLYNDCMR